MSPESQAGVRETSVTFSHAPTAPSWMPPRPGFTASEFERLADAGVFGGIHAELIRGEILKVNAQYVPHAFVKMALYDATKAAVGSERLPWFVFCEVSVRMSEDFVPIPDVVVWAKAEGEEAPRTFVPRDAVKLIVEVGDATVKEDTGVKLEEYARAGLSEYWVADVQKRTLFLHADPIGDTYARRVPQPFGAKFDALTLPLAIDTSSLIQA